MAELRLSNGGVALIDDEDLPLVAGKKWRWHKYPKRDPIYVLSGGNGKAILLHRLIANAPRWAVVDHINGDGLDNRRANLRICTIAENSRNRPRLNKTNRSGYRGVSWHQATQKWSAGIRHMDRQLYLGEFDSKEEAARAYNAKAIELFGEFAFLNSA